MRSRLVWSVVPVAVVCLAGSLSACGGSGQSSAAPTRTVTATVTVTAPSSSDPGTVVPTTGSSASASTSPVSPSPTSAVPSGSSSSTSDPGPIDLSDPPGTFAAAMAHVATADSSVTLPRFQTAHGDVYCLLKDRYNPPSCEVASQGAIPDASYCGDGPASTSVGRLEFDGTKPRAICNSDTIRGESASTVAPGTVVTASGGAVECVVESIGVTCVDTRAQTGFFLTLGRYTVFG